MASQSSQTVQRTFFDKLSTHAGSIDWGGSDLRDRVRGLAASRLLAPADFLRLTARGGAIPNTDRNRRLEYFTPRYNQVVTDMRRDNLYAFAGLASFPRMTRTHPQSESSRTPAGGSRGRTTSGASEFERVPGTRGSPRAPLTDVGEVAAPRPSFGQFWRSRSGSGDRGVPSRPVGRRRLPPGNSSRGRGSARPRRAVVPLGGAARDCGRRHLPGNATWPLLRRLAARGLLLFVVAARCSSTSGAGHFSCGPARSRPSTPSVSPSSTIAP